MSMDGESAFTDGVGAELAGFLDARGDELAGTLMDLVRVPTQVPPGENYGLIVESLLPELGELGFDARRLDVPQNVFEERSRVHYPELVGDRANVLATVPDSGRPKVVFYCHLDTMPAGERERWSFDPHEPFVRDGRVWGRGASDPKGGVTAILWAFRALRELGIELAVDPIVAFTTDEEVGPYTGLMYMADTGAFAGARQLFSTDGLATSIGYGLQGALTWEVRIKGRGGHSGFSHLHANPIEGSGAVMERLLALKSDVAARRSAVTLSPDVAAMLERTHLHADLNVTMVNGGVKHNAVPSELVLGGDRRFLPEEDEATCVEEIRAAVGAGDAELTYEVRTRPFYTSFAGDPESRWVRYASQIASAAHGEAIPPAGVPGASDVSYTAKSTGMQLAILGTGRLDSNGHAPDERCELRDVIAAAKTVALLAATWRDDPR